MISMCGVRIQGDKSWINIICIYRRPNAHVRVGAWKDILKNVNEREATIVAGDFNAHHTSWNCEKTDSMSERLMEEFDSIELFVVNDDTKTRIGEVGQADSNIDLIFANDKAMDMIKISIAEETWGSDHFPLFFELGIDRRIYKKISHRISNKRTDWPAYSGWLMDHAQKIKEENYIVKNREERYEEFIGIVKTAVYEAKRRKKADNIGKRIVNREEEGKSLTSKKKQTKLKREDNIKKRKEGTTSHRRRKRNPVEWWDQECDEAIQKRREAQKEYIKKRDLGSKIEFKRSIAEARKIIRGKKKENFRNFANSLNRHMNMSYV